MRSAALYWLGEPCARAKAQGVQALMESWKQGKVGLNPHDALFPSASIPGRPERPELVSPLSVKRRSMRTEEGRATLIHALAHIEFNAINLALDAVWRFPEMPNDYYADWLKVAAEEALHFSLLESHLRVLGHAYGAFPAHNSLWDMAEKTGHDALARMALVPRTMEARGLDATPAVRAKLAQAGDTAAAEILDIILRDEIGHVAIGNRWYAWLCAQRNLDAVATYRTLARQYKAPTLRRPFNMEARRAAGFSEEELIALEESADTPIES
ncbi:ferritin-like domain-containing protein [Oxalobacteraceae bacterium R-40]|uniref:Ferritin-like domain-containing protein n=2 Tax=Keguizhuia sedimenti TaxID=3064264 RepID=A0ABU1BRT2_9BURK|nr:ferritin-like domain-containing protein [Oxalobacteraceae bacterium R-40]